MTTKPTSRFTPYIKASLRLGLGLGLLACLLWFNRASIAQLFQQQIRWEFFLAGLVITFAAILVTILRWYLLVIAQGLSFRLRDSMRIGFIGFLFSQVIPGA